MEKEFVPYELAVKLKELGFDEPCFGWYDGRYIASINQNYCKNSEEWLNTIHCAAPLYQQAFRWFREKYELFHSTNYQDDNSGPGCFDYEILDKRGKTQVEDHGPEFKTYEEAERACLTKLIEIVEQQNQK